MVGFKFATSFDGRQMERDTVIQFPHAQALVSAGEWVLSDATGPQMAIPNVCFRELLEPTTPEAAKYLAESVPVYIPKPNEDAAAAGPD